MVGSLAWPGTTPSSYCSAASALAPCSVCRCDRFPRHQHFGAILFLGGIKALISFPSECFEAISKFNLTPIPLFILMGEILFHTGVAFRAIDAVDRLIVRVPGRLSGGFALRRHDLRQPLRLDIASTAMIGNTLLPRMMKAGYERRSPWDPIMAVGGIDMLIPRARSRFCSPAWPEQSVAALLIAGIVPGLLMAAIFVAYV